MNRLHETGGAWAPLSGVRVVDFSMFVPGPFASSILGDLGAEVIKVEPPRGDPGRAYIPVQFATENRGKRSIAVDLKNPLSREIVARLARRSDVAIEGFRPGVAARLGIGYGDLKKENPKIVYCSISGYGQTGPWKDHPGHDVNYIAAAGGLAFPGQWRKAPARSSLPVADMAGGSFAAIAILAALKEGKGAHLDLSMFESAFFMAAMRHSTDPQVDPRAHLFPVNDVFECADGRRLTLGVLEEHFWRNFAQLVPELADARFASDASRRVNGEQLSGLLEKIFKEKTSAEWLKLCEANDVPVDLCVNPGEAARDNPQLRERKATSRGFALFPAFANGARAGELRRGVPRPGEHAREILVELGFDDAGIADMVKNGVLGPVPGTVPA